MDELTYRKIGREMDRAPRMMPAVFVILVNALLLGLGVWLFAVGGVFSYLLSQCLLALWMNHCFIIVHECVHRSFVPSHRLNDLLGNLFAVGAVLPFQARRKDHLGHHTWTGNLRYEPALQQGVKVFVHGLTPFRRVLIEMTWRLWFPVFAMNQHWLLWGMVREPRIFLSGLWTGCVWLGIGMGLGGDRMLWMVPAFFGYFFLVELVNLPHHLDILPYEGENKRPLWEHDSLTSSCHRIPFVSPVLLLNFNYHVEHHFFPRIPWWQLRRVNDRLVREDARYSRMHREIPWSFEIRRRPFDWLVNRYQPSQSSEKMRNRA